MVVVVFYYSHPRQYMLVVLELILFFTHIYEVKYHIWIIYTLGHDQLMVITISSTLSIYSFLMMSIFIHHPVF
jgi:hypothetical protein